MFDLIAVPFGYLLKWIFDFVGSYGLSIILFTVFTKVLMYPLMLKSKKSMRQVQKLQPKMNALQERYKTNKQKYQEEVAKLYQEEKVNPAGSCLPMLVTLPIMMGLYYVIQQPLTYLMHLDTAQILALAETLGVTVNSASLRMSEITIASGLQSVFASGNAGQIAEISAISSTIFPIDFYFLGINLAEKATLGFKLIMLIPILSGFTAWLSMTYTQKLQGVDTSAQAGQMKAMSMMMPCMSAYFGFILPAGLGIYWITGNLYTMAQEFVMHKQLSKIDALADEKTKEKEEREAENRRKELEIKKEEQRKVAKEIAEKNK